MRLLNYINEDIDKKLEKIIKVFEKIPSNTPDAISDYIVKTLNLFNVKSEHGNSTYISGPMTNLPDDNWPVFIYAEKYLNGDIINPAKPHGFILKKSKKDFKWVDYMTEDIYNMLRCNKIVLLPGYSKSTGATVEILVGKKLLGIKPIEFKKVVSKKNYQLYINDVKNQYYKDGFKKQYDNIIKPMLNAESEAEAAKYVKTYIPEEYNNINEDILKSIKNFVKYIKDGSIKTILKLIGLILQKSNIKKIIR